VDNQHLPNILFIMADQHRSDCLGAYGNPDIRTPHLDQLASEGVVYENHFCNAPVCTPSRYSTLTGLYPHQHLGWTNRCTVQPGLATYPNLLKRAGYTTKAIGKMHLTPTYQDVGFDQMELAEQNGDGRYEDDYHRYLQGLGLIDYVDLLDQVQEYRDQAPEHYWSSRGAMVSDLPEEHHSTAWIGRKGLEAIEQWGDGGNLLFLSFIKPHHPFDPPVPWNGMYDPNSLQLLPGWTESCLPRDLQMHTGFFPHEQLSEQQLRLCMSYYYATISHIDDYIGKITELLKRKGLYENTLIIYTSDHGEYLGYHHLLLKQNYMYDPLVKVPLIVKYPGKAAAGTRCADLTSGIDIGVTLAAAAGEKPGGDMTGLDLSASLEKRDYVFAENARGSQYMVRSRSHKLILCKDDAKSLFFDLTSDPLEMNDLYGDPAYRDIIREHKTALQQLILFDAPAPVFLYEEAARIAAQNVPSGGGLTETFAGWVREKVAEHTASEPSIVPGKSGA
jgi:arylsulfatase